MYLSMRKTYFALTTILLWWLSFNVTAQTSSTLVSSLGEPLITDVSQLSSNASDEEEGKYLEYLIDGDPGTFWHSDWHGKVTDPHYLQVDITEPVKSTYVVVYLQRRKHDLDHLVNARLDASEDGKTWETLADWELGNATSSAELLTDPVAVSKPYCHFRLINTKTSPIYFHAAEFEIYNPSEADLIMGELDKIANKYDAYLYGDRNALNVGTGVGQFTDGETADRIIAALEKLISWMEDNTAEGYPATKEAAAAFGEEIDALYAKYKESEVLYRLPADGYYRIIANLPYQQTVETGEIDENNHPITETTLATKAMFCGINYQGMWGTVKNDMANYVWKLTQTGDSIDMYNVGMEARFNIVTSNVRLSEEGNKAMIFDYAGTEEGKTIVYIRAATDPRGAEKYLHQNDHGKGTRIEDAALVVWKGTIDMGAPYETDKGTSEWYLEPVSEEEVQALVEAFAPIKNHDILVEQNKELRAKVNAAIVAAKDRKKRALVTSGTQMSSPFSQNAFGDQDGGNLEDGVLIDNDPGTYWHSVWSAGDVETGTHYIQISDMEQMTGDIVVYVRRRDEENNHPTEFTIKASNDPETDATEWVTLAVLPLGNATRGAEFTTDPFNAGETPYKYVRLYGSKNGFWHSAELQIYKLEDNPNSQFAALGELATNLEKIYLKNVTTADADITMEDYLALKEAFEAFSSGMVDPTALRNVLSKYTGYAKGMIEGEQPGQWKDTKAYEAFNTLYQEMTAYNEAGIYNQDEINHYVAALDLAADNFMASANIPKTDTWYRIKFPSEEMYDTYNWSKANITGNDVATPIYDNYVTIGKGNHIEETGMYDYQPVLTEDVREGTGLYLLDKENLEEEPDASLFRFVKIDSQIMPFEDVQKLKQRSRLALEMTSSVTVGNPLITSSKQFSSNASDEEEGKFFEYLVDGNAGTFWHSDWHNKVTEPHYLQIALAEPISGFIQVDMTRRANSENGSLVRMYVTASNDGADWTRIGYVELPYGSSDERVYSTPIDLNGTYSHLRFTMTQRRGDDTEYDPFGDKCTFFHAAEFQIRPLSITGGTNAAQSLKTALSENNKVLIKDLSTADYTILATAYNNLQKEINVGKHAVVPENNLTPVRYAIQNKATGLFINTAAKNSNDVTLQLMPSLISPAVAGYGENVLRSDNFDGTYCSYLHVQKNNHRFVTWDDKSAGSNSGLIIEEVEPAEESDFTFTKDILFGKINAWCYPVSIQSDDYEIGAYTVVGTYTGEDEKLYLALNEANEAKAGQPVIYILGTTEDWIEGTEEEPAETTPVLFTLSTDINFEAGAENGLVGTLKKTHVETGTQTFVDNTVVSVKAEDGADIAANQAYLDLNACPKAEEGKYTMSILLPDASGTGIASTVSNISKSGNIYTVDGKLVRVGGTLNDVKKLGKGTYILNGVKVFVK